MRVRSQPLPEFNVEPIVLETGLVDIFGCVLMDVHKVVFIEGYFIVV